MTKDAIPSRHPALEGFMSELRALRESAGQPSFRTMARNSGAVSHATLHLSVTGYRLQPWETVREFVRACDGDEAVWHERWRRVASQLAGHPAGQDESPCRFCSGEAPPQRSARKWLIPAAAGLVAACAIGVVAVVNSQGNTPAGPVKESTSQQPLYPGDVSVFLADVSVPDGTVVKPGSTFDKFWEIQNAGTVEWTNRYLQRDDSIAGEQPCRTPDRIPVEHTMPGENVKIRVRVQAPKAAPSGCKVYWKMVDASGRRLFPGARPIYFEVQVRN